MFEQGAREFVRRASFALIVGVMFAFTSNVNDFRQTSMAASRSTWTSLWGSPKTKTEAEFTPYLEAIATPSLETESLNRYREALLRRQYEEAALYADRQSQSGPGFVGTLEWQRLQERQDHYYQMMK
jgi:hypothetical protein